MIGTHVFSDLTPRCLIAPTSNPACIGTTVLLQQHRFVYGCWRDKQLRLSLCWGLQPDMWGLPHAQRVHDGTRYCPHIRLGSVIHARNKQVALACREGGVSPVWLCRTQSICLVRWNQMMTEVVLERESPFHSAQNSCTYTWRENCDPIRHSAQVYQL